MYLVNVDSAPYGSIDELLSNITESSQQIYSQMDDDETLWIVCTNQYGEDGCRSVALELADSIREEAPFTLKNTVTVHTNRECGGKLGSIYKEILFLVKDKRNYKFNKDAIRIPHVYKGNEWGGEREKGSSAYHDTEVRRYNPDGKDPGNVWTEDDRAITNGENVDETRPTTLDEAVERCVLAGSDEDEIVHTLWMDSPDEIAGRPTEPMKMEIK